MLRLGDVARVELGRPNYGFVSRFNGKPAAGLAVTLATSANALDTADGVAAVTRAARAELPATA